MTPEAESVIHAVTYDDDSVRVVADIAGNVPKDTIDLRCDSEEVIIDVCAEHTRARTTVGLPQRVDEHSAAASYNNGVLEVVFD